jgi:hypothetical protein
MAGYSGRRTLHAIKNNARLTTLVEPFGRTGVTEALPIGHRAEHQKFE